MVRFEFTAGALCLDFANTIHDTHAEDNGEELQEISDLLQWAKDGGLLSSADHRRLTAHYIRRARDAAGALARSVAARDLMLTIFSAVANGRPVPRRRLSELNAALAHTPGLLRVDHHAGRIGMGWESAANGLRRILFAVLTSAA